MLVRCWDLSKGKVLVDAVVSNDVFRVGASLAKVS